MDRHRGIAPQACDDRRRNGQHRPRLPNDLGADPVTLSQSPALGLSDGTITFDYKDGTGNTPVQLILTDNSGTEALVLNVNSSSSQLVMDAANAPNFEDGSSMIAVNHPNLANITVDFDVATDMVTVNADGTAGGLMAAPVTFAFDNAVSEIKTITWSLVAEYADWNLTEITINGTDAPEPASLALLGMGSLCFLRRRRAA